MTEPTNAAIAAMFEEVARLLQSQNALTHRVRAWRRGATVIAELDMPIGDLYRAEGIAGLEAIRGIGYRLARVVVEIIRTGTTSTLERLRGGLGPAAQLTTLPGIGEVLAERLHHELGVSTLEELHEAAQAGRLHEVPGIGARREAALRAIVAERLADPASAPPRSSKHDEQPPSVSVLLEVDRLYRSRATRGTLPRIAPKRNNPRREAWLPILHHDHGDWSFTALYSNTALAHQLHKTGDWVVLYYEHDHAQGQATVVTEWRGQLAGRRVVRGRERACAAYYRDHDRGQAVAAAVRD